MKRYLFLFFLVTTGCLGPVTELYPEDEDERPIPIYLISHGWHVGIAIESTYIKDHLPDHEKMPAAKYLKFGWGDGKYYSDSDAGFGLLIRAALWPTRSVLHVVGMDVPPDRYFSRSDIIKVQISRQGADEFAQFISDRFRRHDEGNVLFYDDGLYNNSSFFEATGLYYLPKTSNTWTARALRSTGYPITPFYSLTSGNVIQQARKDGEIIRLK
ncbi:MAG: DUF2459 domain-containing protein [Balneolaceae bacterium]